MHFHMNIINNNAFSDCSNLQTVIFNGLEEPKTCKRNAFTNIHVPFMIKVPYDYDQLTFCEYNVEYLDKENTN